MSYEGKWFAHGKLMLMGEFFVLRGSSCIAVPTALGQSLSVSTNSDSNTLLWRASILDKSWFDAEYSLNDFEVLRTCDSFKAESFARLLRVARELNPNFLNEGVTAHTNLTFPQNWGLGSSSTLIKLLGDWSTVDPLAIHFATSTGSGFDVAAAIAKHPIIYRTNAENPVIEEIIIPEIVKSSCFFVYLGKKQNSQKSVKLFLQRGDNSLPTQRIDAINRAFLSVETADTLCELMREHEELLSPILDLKRVKKVLFNDFKGEVKSLGAWGGDFVMACTEHPREYVEAYFKKKGLHTLFSYNELLL